MTDIGRSLCATQDLDSAYANILSQRCRDVPDAFLADWDLAFHPKTDISYQLCSLFQITRSRAWESADVTMSTARALT